MRKFDELYKAYGGIGASDTETLPDNVDEFVERCKQAESGVADDSTDVEEVEDVPIGNENSKRMLRMGKDRKIWLIEPDGTKKQITYPEAGKLHTNSVLYLTQALKSGADFRVFELN